MFKQLMTTITSFSKPVLTGVLVALPLFAVLWHQVGSLYAHGLPVDSYQIINIGLLFNEVLLLIPTLTIALLTGMAAGAVSAKRSESDAAVRGGVAVAVFAIFVGMPTVMNVTGRGDSFWSSFTNVSPVWIVPLLLLQIVLLLGFTLLSSLEFIAAAAAGGALGRRLISWRRWSFYGLSTVLFAAVLFYVAYYGAVTRSVLNTFHPKKVVIQREVERNLMKPSGKWTWRTRLKAGYPPRLGRITCDSRSGIVTVKISPEKTLESAHLTVWMPRSASRVPGTKAEAAKMLQKCAVREPLLRTLHEEHGMWTSEHGKFSVALSINYD